jgi:Ca2+-dependent lipid-binding protein
LILGTSDPYVQFSLNGEKVYKSQVIKKNCNPDFDEKFEIAILSRTNAKFLFEVFDWNAISAHEKLGGNTIDLTELEPYSHFEKSYPLSGAKGEVRLSMVFRPEFIQKKRNSTSTFSRALTAVDGVITGGDKAVKSGANVVGSGAKLVTSGFGLLGKKPSESTNSPVVSESPLLSRPVSTISTTGPLEVKDQSTTPIGEQENGTNLTNSTNQQISSGMSGNLH